MSRANDTRDEIELETKEQNKRIKRELYSKQINRVLLGKQKNIEPLKHPILLVNALEGFGDFLVDSGYHPTYASIALYIGTTKETLNATADNDRSYYYWEVSDRLGTIIATLPIYEIAEIDMTPHGGNIDLTKFVAIEELINNYELSTASELSVENVGSLKRLSKGCFIKYFHNKIYSKKSIDRSCNKHYTKRSEIYKIRLRGSKIKELYAQVVRGDVRVRNCTFADFLQGYRQISELEWIEAGKVARNPAMSIFMLMNRSGFAPEYQNKQITEVRSSIAKLEEQEHQGRLESLVQKLIGE